MNSNDVYFIYDGGCPICTYAAKAFRIKQAVGNLHLINAREDRMHPLILQVNQKGLNLDEGMAIVYQGNFYHGHDALHFMSLIGSDMGWFNKMNIFLFRAKAIAKLCYPAMRCARNLLIKINRTDQIDNLNIKSKPIFQAIFGDAWHKLPPVMRKHYANHAHADQTVTAEGHLTIESSDLGRALFPLLRALKILIPREEADVRTTVHFVTKADDNLFRFDRSMTFADGSTWRFLSAMQPVSGNELVEFMAFGIGWRLSYNWDGQKITLNHKGYVLKIFGLLFPLPLEFILGRGYAEETPINDNEFSMMTEISHPLWGKIYGYSGKFRMVK